MKIHSELEGALFEKLGGQPTGAGLQQGRVWYDTTDDKVKYYDGDEILEFNTSGAGGDSSINCVWAAGQSASVTYEDTMDYIEAATVSNASDWNDLNTGRRAAPGACAGETKGLVAGGYDGSAMNEIEVIDIATKSAGVNHGVLSFSSYSTSSAGNSARWITAGGSSSTSMDYGTYTVSGGSTFDTLTQGREELASCANTTYALHGGGAAGGNRNEISRSTISTTSSEADTGDLTVARQALRAAAYGTNALFCGGNTGSYSDVTDRLNPNTGGNAADWEDLRPGGMMYCSGCSSTTKAFFGSGQNSSSVKQSFIDYFEYSAAAESLSWGDLTVARTATCAFANLAS